MARVDVARRRLCAEMTRGGTQTQVSGVPVTLTKIVNSNVCVPGWCAAAHKRVSGLQTAVAAAEEQQRTAVALDVELENAADDDRVVAAVVLGLDDAVDPG